MAVYTLVGRNEFPSTDPTRVGKTDVIYVYQDERLNSIVLTIPSEEDTPEEVEKRLRERIAAATEAGPRSIEVE
jgi:hypothetical protein